MSSSEEEISPVKVRVFKAHKKGKEKQEKAKMVQEVADNKMAEGKDTTNEKKDKGSKGKAAKDCKEDEVSMLTERLEERPSLWDVSNKDYSKRDVKDTAFLDVILLKLRAKSMD